MENTTKIRIEFIPLLALGFAAIIFYKRLSPNNNTTSPTLPPGPRGYPLVGCLPEMLKNKPTFRWIHKLMQQLNTEIACIHLGNIHVIPLTSPELAREFLKKHDAIFASRPDIMSARLTSNGYSTLALSPMGNQWKKMRRVLVSEVLSQSMHRWMHEKRRDEGDHLVCHVYKKCENGLLVNVRDVARHYCGNVARKMVFGRRFFGPGMEDGGPGFEEREHVDGVFTILSYLYGFAIGDYVPWLEVFDLDGCKKILGNAIKNVRKYQDLEIAKRVEMWQHGDRDVKEDILDVLINLRDSENNPLLSIQEIKAQVLEIMIESIDNPSNAVEWAMAEMINQPHILAKATEELDRVVGKERMVQESDLGKLNFVKACIKESFRLHPIAPFNVPHVSTKDVLVGGYFIPEGSHVLLSRVGLGRNPRLWEDPLEYKPECHMGSEVVLVDPELRMLSFSTGRRGCPGVVLGSTLTALLLARLIQGFSWSATNISLDESEHELALAKPLIAQPMPRKELVITQWLVVTNIPILCTNLFLFCNNAHYSFSCNEQVYNSGHSPKIMDFLNDNC